MITAIVMGLVGGLLIKALFRKESHPAWAVAFGVVGGLVAYYLRTALPADVTRALFSLGVAVVVAGVLYEVWTRFTKTA